MKCVGKFIQELIVSGTSSIDWSLPIPFYLNNQSMAAIMLQYILELFFCDQDSKPE